MIAAGRKCPNCGAPVDAPGWGAPRVLLVIAGLIVLAGAVAAIVFVVRAGKVSHDLDQALVPHPGRPLGYQGGAYPGMLTQDHVAGPEGAVDTLGERVTAARLRREPSLLGATLCADVAIANHSHETRNYGPAEWKLQDPDGTVQTFGLTGTLGSGQIAPGGAAKGTVCFADTGPLGGFLVLWQPLFTVGRGVWMFGL